MSSRNVRFVALAERLRREHPEVHEPIESSTAGRVLVDGVVITNPRGLVHRHALISVANNRPLRGTLKLRAALATFEVSTQGCVAMDVGASTGGFTTALLEAGAKRVYTEGRDQRAHRPSGRPLRSLNPPIVPWLACGLMSPSNGSRTLPSSSCRSASGFPQAEWCTGW